MAALVRRPTSGLRLWTNYRFHTSTAPEIKDTGLYGFDHLKTPNGFRRFVDEAIERSGELVNFVSGMPSSTEIIRAMDEISDTVCSVVDSAELCRHTHPDRDFVEEANKASLRINEYIHYLNTNHALYNAVIKAQKDGRSINEEAQRAAHSLRIDFEKGGIHLGADKQDRVNQLQIEVSQLTRQFNENISSDPGYVDIFPASRIPKLLHHLVKPIYRSTFTASRESSKSRGNLKEKGFRIVTEPSTLSSVLQWTSDSEVRKMAYVQGNSVPSANIGVLDKLIATRHEIAQMYADNGKQVLC
jgi:intermediate peptidase